MFKKLLIVTLLLSSAGNISYTDSNADIVDMRTENTKTYAIDDSYLLEISSGAIHYKDDYDDNSELWKDINLNWDGKRLDTAPYILLKVENGYRIINKKTREYLSIYADTLAKNSADISEFDLRLFNTGFSLDRTIYSADDLNKDATFRIDNEYTDSISISFQAYDDSGEPVSVDYSYKDGIITETISSESMLNKSFPITINPVIEIDIDSGDSDGWIRTPSSFLSTGTWMAAGNDSSYSYSMFVGYDGISIQSGAIISDVYASLYLTDARADTLTYMYFADEQNPDLPLSYADVTSYAHTTNQVDWNDETNTGDYIDTPSLLNPFLEIFNNYGFNNERAILVITDNGSASADFYKADTFEAGNVPKLYINYTVPDVPDNPDNFILSDLGGITLNASWDYSSNTTDYLLLISRDSCPLSPDTDIYETAYYGTGNSVNITGVDLDDTRIYATLFSRNEVGYSNGICDNIGNAGISFEGEGMNFTYFLALIPLVVFLILSIIFYGKGLIHLLTIGYAGILGFLALQGGWGILFIPVCGVSFIIGMVLFVFAMTRGGLVII